MIIVSSLIGVEPLFVFNKSEVRAIKEVNLFVFRTLSQPPPIFKSQS